MSNQLSYHNKRKKLLNYCFFGSSAGARAINFLEHINGSSAGARAINFSLN